MTPIVLLLSLTGLLADNPPAAGDDPKHKLEPAHMRALTDALGAKGHTINGKVFILSLPREDLEVRTLDFGQVPVEAGLTTTLKLWRCPCGKYYFLGEYVVTDFESNDVLDSLRQGSFTIASVSPILVRENPRILSLRFQGEGEVDHIVKTMKEAQRWIGENRSKPKPIK